MTQWKTTSTVDDLNGRQSQQKTTSTEVDLNRRWPQQKSISTEDDLNGRWPQRKMTSKEDDLKCRQLYRKIISLEYNNRQLVCPHCISGSELGLAKPQLVLNIKCFLEIKRIVISNRKLFISGKLLITFLIICIFQHYPN